MQSLLSEVDNVEEYVVIMIREFQGQYRFLSNFWMCKVSYEGRVWRSVEHAFQGAKCKLEEDKQRIFDIEKPGEAKRFGRIVKMRQDWEDVKLSIMETLLWEKFKDPLLRQWLINTGNNTLQEGNHWHDIFWGIDLISGEGENQLGKLLMKVRRGLSGMWIWVDAGYFVGGFGLGNDLIVQTAPPIARWAIGKHIDQVLDYYSRKMQLDNWVLFKDGIEVKYEWEKSIKREEDRLKAERGDLFCEDKSFS